MEDISRLHSKIYEGWVIDTRLQRERPREGQLQLSTYHWRVVIEGVFNVFDAPNISPNAPPHRRS